MSALYLQKDTKGHNKPSYLVFIIIFNKQNKTVRTLELIFTIIVVKTGANVGLSWFANASRPPWEPYYESWHGNGNRALSIFVTVAFQSRSPSTFIYLLSI
jgi:hypothetical protein